jgi:hypothetical protein
MSSFMEEVESTCQFFHSKQSNLGEISLVFIYWIAAAAALGTYKKNSDIID